MKQTLKVSLTRLELEAVLDALEMWDDHQVLFPCKEMDRLELAAARARFKVTAVLLPTGRIQARRSW